MVGRVAGLVLLLAACSPFEPANDRPLDPPAQYRIWWAKTEQCSGLVGDFNRVQWFVVPGAQFECPTGQCVGRWESSGHRIYLAEDWMNHEMVVRHEMLHDLIGHSGHPTPPFGSPCPLTWQTWTGSGSVEMAPVEDY